MPLLVLLSRSIPLQSTQIPSPCLILSGCSNNLDTCCNQGLIPPCLISKPDTLFPSNSPHSCPGFYSAWHPLPSFFLSWYVLNTAIRPTFQEQVSCCYSCSKSSDGSLLLWSTEYPLSLISSLPLIFHSVSTGSPSFDSNQSPPHPGLSFSSLP